MTELPRTIPDGFLDTARRQPDAVALRWRDATGFAEQTWQDYADRVARMAATYATLGVARGERILLFLRNRPEFHVADLGALFAGATPISIYNSSSAEQVSYLAGHSDATVAVVEAGTPLERVLAIRDQLPSLRAVVVVDGDGTEPGTLAFADLLASADPVDLDAAAVAVEPDDLVTVIYTSGTTGAPKGVMLDHGNVLAQYAGLLHFLGPDGSAHRLVSYLPMAHIAERMVSHYNHVLWGPQVTCCPDLAQLASYLVHVRPTVLFGPPRVWEKLYAGIRAAVAASGKQDDFERGRDVGRRVAELRARGEELPPDLAETWAFVDAVAFAPLRARVGLDACDVAFSGAAPIPVEVVQFFRDIGVSFSEIYGMSENTGGMTWDPYEVKIGAVGRAYPGNDVRLGEDGEVLCRGPIVFRGYLGDPERTREALDEDGWLHTGDIGVFDDDGYLRIVDRKKELIITAGGKNISPANIEAALKTVPLVGQAAAVGDGRPYVVALLVLDPDAVRSRYGDRDLTEVAADADVRRELADGVAAVNERFAQVERVKRVAVVGEEWLPDSDVLTPTMKLKRRGVAQRYASVIEDLYAGGGVEVPRSVPAPATT